MSPRAATRGALLALAALAAAGAPARPASADVLPDNYPTPQAVLAHAEFLAQVPAPPSGAGTVCVIDTGVTPLPDLAGQIVERIAIDGGSGDDIRHHADDPFSGHGSFVAGTIASQVDGVGSAGIWPAAKIISVRVFRDATGGATSADYRTAINACALPSRNVTVISMSLGASFADANEVARLENKVVDARLNGINVVAASGNSGNLYAVDYPAMFQASFAVGASDVTGSACTFSNRGEGLDLSALGCDVVDSAFDGHVALFKGTSFAAPTVAGILSALRAYGRLSAGSAEDLLLATARSTSAGLVVDADAAFRAAGLATLVDSYRPPARPSDDSSREVGTKVETSFTPEVVDGKPRTPRLRVALFRKHRITLKVTRAPRRGTVVFSTGRKVYRRASGELVIRTRDWRPVTVQIEDEWGVRSAQLKIVRPTER